MSKVAILSDIHGNLPAFEAVLEEVDSLDLEMIIFGGDIVGYGASPAECLDLVRERGGHCVFGNHETYTVAVADNGVASLGDDWHRDPVEAGVVHAFRSLSKESLNWIRNLPWFLPIEEDVVIAHATLHEPDSWNYIHSEKTAEPTLDIMKKRGLNIGFFGHIHELGVFPSQEPAGNDYYLIDPDKQVAITVGSVGQPRDPDDNRATWVVYDSRERSVQFKRTEYDAEKAARQIMEAGLPTSSAARLL